MADVTIIGAGVVGLACGIEFQRRGYHVTLLDSAEPGHGCSYGNAGIIAVSEVFPIISPAHVRSLPRMLLSRDAPASICMNAFPRLAGWLLRAAASLTPARQRAITASLCALNRLALPAWRNLLDDCGARELLAERGMIRLIRTDRGRTPLEHHRRALAEFSIDAELLSAHDVHELEPNLDASVVGGLLHASDAHVRSPLEVSFALLKRFVQAGGEVIGDRAVRLVPREQSVEVVTRSGSRTATKVVVTAGLESAGLVEPLGVRAPLQAERGYHLMLPSGGDVAHRPVTFQAESCVATPMGDRLRLAGTVEFARSDGPPTWSRAERLAAIAQRYFATPLHVSGVERWVGSRPSLPDSLPAIGRLTRHPAVGYAFGHQHLGLTQAAVSAKLVAAQMHGEPPAIDLHPFDLARF